MKLVKYLKPHKPYAIGDITKIEDEEAKELAKAGVLKIMGKKEKTVEKAVEKKEDKMIKKAEKK